eukprot:GHVU01032822.1.p1 GENE.GHVU01032822.1~~GHVU01032822.1.p1  ORF type:complete len:114 (-),score=1.63 GHVU01032822.1:356-697(-)
MYYKFLYLFHSGVRGMTEYLRGDRSLEPRIFRQAKIKNTPSPAVLSIKGLVPHWFDLNIEQAPFCASPVRSKGYTLFKPDLDTWGAVAEISNPDCGVIFVWPSTLLQCSTRRA